MATPVATPLAIDTTALLDEVKVTAPVEAEVALRVTVPLIVVELALLKTSVGVALPTVTLAVVLAVL